MSDVKTVEKVDQVDSLTIPNDFKRKENTPEVKKPEASKEAAPSN